MSIYEDLTYIEAFLQKTLKANRQLTNEVSRLNDKNELLQSQVKEKEKLLEEITNKSLNLQITNVAGDDREKEKLISRIDEMVKEVDHCLKLLKSK